jgi:hypothetical protein
MAALLKTLALKFSSGAPFAAFCLLLSAFCLLPTDLHGFNTHS